MIRPDPLRNLGPATILRADARTLPLADNSVDLIVTSPPYFALRSYRDGGEHYRGQLGSEATPAEFVDALIDCTREMVRVVKPSGSIWINLGDKYAGAANEKPHTGSANIAQPNQSRNVSAGRPAPLTSVRGKSLIGIPWRYALRCIDDLGLILRAEVIWSKPNGLPESVTDRVRRSHEQWFMFTLQPRYYSAVDEIREPQTGSLTAQSRPEAETRDSHSGNSHRKMRRDPGMFSPLGKLPGSVWTIPTEPLRVPDHLGVDHFAAFPSEWPKRIIRGWSPAGVCTACGEGRRPVAEAEYTDAGGRGNEKWNRVEQGSGDYEFGSFKPQEMRLGRANRTTTITGYACACPEPTAPTTPALILDPFGGTGTVAMVARALGRHGIHADLSADYNRLARWRITDLDQLAAIQGHQRIKREPDTGDLLTLLDDGGAA